jgi:DNA gyrase subunit A
MLNDDELLENEIEDDEVNTELETIVAASQVKPISITHEMKNSFLNYAMSVIVSRALPDVRDGLKPVHRRILFAMHELGMHADKPYKKSARIVGEVMGKYHPHGDSSIYDAMVRMAQPFSYRSMLIDGHGNFGSIDGDAAAAMRYTEARLSKIAGELVRDIDKDTVSFADNYDASEQEPTVLPARYPNLLVNGSTGIAVGMATNIPPHNLGEVIYGILAYMKNRELTSRELMDYIPAPDFPTGGQVLGMSGLIAGYETGRGRIIMRAQSETKQLKNGKYEIIITEIPYQVNKTSLIERIAEVVKEKIVDGITNLTDLSNRKGIRIVIELRKDANPSVVLNNLFKYTQLQTSFGINMIALVKGQPKTVNLKDCLAYYVEHQMEVILRRTQYELKKALERMHILEAFVKALADVDEVIRIIKESRTTEIARNALIEKYDFSDIQARAILALQLGRLTGLEIDKIHEETENLKLKIIDYNDIIASDIRKETIIVDELSEIKERFATPRMSEINLMEDIDIDNEDLIDVEDIIVTVTNNGYIKRMSTNEYETQNRGGVGRVGIKLQEDDYVEHIAMTSTHDFHLFFTNLGRVFKIKGYKLPSGSRTSKGVPIVNFLNFQEGEYLASFTSIRNFDDEDATLVFITKNGLIKRTSVSKYQNIRQNGIIACTLKDGDELLAVRVTDGDSDIILGSTNAKAIRFKENDIRLSGRSAAGVKAMSLAKDAKIIGVAVVKDEEQSILVVTENGFGKRTKVSSYPVINRGGKGVITLAQNDKKGVLATLRAVEENQDLIIISNEGISIRMQISNISETSRITQGIRLINLKGDQKVATVAVVAHQEIEEISETASTTTITQEPLPLETDVKVETVELTTEENESDEVKVIIDELV